ncbi:hypothetical protein C8F01DRAFT_720351 [Mycena amicta]|nr:hypothetical protein C8F01DRAFT_720351 [Mycena amicta]
MPTTPSVVGTALPTKSTVVVGRRTAATLALIPVVPLVAGSALGTTEMVGTLTLATTATVHSIPSHLTGTMPLKLSTAVRAVSSFPAATKAGTTATTRTTWLCSRACCTTTPGTMGVAGTAAGTTEAAVTTAGTTANTAEVAGTTTLSSATTGTTSLSSSQPLPAAATVKACPSSTVAARPTTTSWHGIQAAAQASIVAAAHTGPTGSSTPLGLVGDVAGSEDKIWTCRVRDVE